MKRVSVIIGTVGVCLLGTLPSLAAEPALSLGTADLVVSGHGAYDYLDIYGAGFAGTEIYSGVYILEKSNSHGAANIWADGPLYGFCMEIQEPAPEMSVTYDVISPHQAYDSILNESVGITKTNYLRELWGRYYDPSWEGTGPFTTSQNKEAAAFAAAIWEIIYEDIPTSPALWDVGIDSTAGIGGFASTFVDATLANSWLSSLDGTGPRPILAVFTNDGSQNYLVAVPEPATVILLGLGGIVSLVRRRRYRH